MPSITLGGLGHGLFPRHRHARDAQRRRGDTASPQKLRTHGVDIHQHVTQVARDGDLLDRVRDLARFRSRILRRPVNSRR